MHRLTTTQLMKFIKNSKSLEDIQSETGEIDNPTLQDYLKELLERSGRTITQIAEETLLDRSFTYQLFNGIRTPSRNHLLRFAFVLSLNVDETQRLLRLAKRGELYPRSHMDALIIYALNKKYTLFQVNELLEQMDETPLFYLE